MAKTLKYLFIAILFPTFFLSTSCVKSIPRINVFTGNFSYSRGKFQKAIIDYLAARKSDMPSYDTVNYNLGNVYYALGEGKAALVLWERAESETKNNDILFRISFNKGLLYYHWGRYQAAYLSFKQALLLNPGNLDAKINLEESLSRIPLHPQENEPSENEVSTNTDNTASRILNFIEQKEATQWQKQPVQFKQKYERLVITRPTMCLWSVCCCIVLLLLIVTPVYSEQAAGTAVLTLEPHKAIRGQKITIRIRTTIPWGNTVQIIKPELSRIMAWWSLPYARPWRISNEDGTIMTMVEVLAAIQIDRPGFHSIAPFKIISDQLRRSNE